MFLGGWLRARHVSIKVLWWLALAMAMREDLSLEPSFSSGGRSWFCSAVVSLLLMERVSIFCIVPSSVSFRIPHRLILGGDEMSLSTSIGG